MRQAAAMLVGVGRALGEALTPLVDLVYPPRCPSCGAAIGAQNGLCSDCWQLLVVPAAPGCARCQRPLPEGADAPDSVCLPCLAHPPLHDGIAAATLYTDISRGLVLSFKHGRKLGLAPFLARMIAARITESAEPRLIVPVPLHRFRLWRRGFNQAAVLARELERLGHGEVLIDGLERRKPTPPLGGMGAKARARALSGAIGVRKGASASLRGRDVILVDDVLTSGATSEACVRALKRAGARSVVIACFARVLNEGRGDRASPAGAPNETPGAAKAPGAA